MIKILYFIGLLIYISVIVLLIFFYNKTVNSKKVKHFKDTKRLKIKSDPFKYASLIEMLIILIGLVIGFVFLAILINKKLMIPKNAILYIQTNDMWASGVVAVFISIPLTGIIMELFQNKNYYYPDATFRDDIKIIIIMQLIIFIIAFPFYILGLGDYAYLTDKYVGTHGFFSVSEKRYSYSDIKEVNVNFKYTGYYKDKYNFSYKIIFNDNKSEDLFEERSNDIIKADKILKSKDVEINRAMISDITLEDIKKDYNEDMVKKIEGIFDIL